MRWLEKTRFVACEERSFVAMRLPDKVGAGRTGIHLGFNRGPSAQRDLSSLRSSGQTLSSGVWLTITEPPPPVFSYVLILKGIKVLCFDTLLEVLILKIVRAHFDPFIQVLILE